MALRDRIKWTDADVLGAREATVEGGPQHGLLVAVRVQGGLYRYPDVFDMKDYVFDPETWRFVYGRAEASP